MTDKPQPLEELNRRVRANGQHLALYMSHGDFTRLAIEEGKQRVRSVAMGYPRKLTVDQAARELLR